MLRLLDRYVMREVVGPLALGFLLYTFILLVRFLFQSAEMIIRQGLPVGTVGKLLLFTLPNILVLTIPMSLLFGVLVAIGRLASDSELVAMRACGVSLLRLYRPILLLSMLLTAANLFLMLVALPWGNAALQALSVEILTRGGTQAVVQPRVFHEEWRGQVLYVSEQVTGGGGWRGIFLAGSAPTSEIEVTIAERGAVQVDERGGRVLLRLENAISHKVDLDAPEKYEVSRNALMTQVLEDQLAPGQAQMATSSKGLRSYTLAELRAALADPKALPDPQGRNLARVEIHKKFSIPFACLVFGFCALPLGFNNRRGGKSSGFALSIGVILLYYILLKNGEEAAALGRLPPWLAMWAPNLFLGVGGVVLALRRNRDRLLMAPFDRWLRLRLARGVQALRGRRAARRERRRAAARSSGRFRLGAPDLVLRLPRLRLRFPNLLDRYVIRLFSWVFLLVATSCVSIYIIADFTEMADDVLRHKASGELVIAYYKYLALQIFYDLSPVVVLITALVVFSLLSRTNEVTAAKALGISLYRLCLPALVASLAVAVMGAYLQTQVLPASNQRVAQLKDRIKGRDAARTYRRADRQWLFGQGRYIYNYLRFDERAQTLHRLQVFEFDEDFHLTRRLFAATARYVGGKWVFTESWSRTFDGVTVTGFERFAQPILVDYPETPEYFQSELKRPEQMRYGELRDYVAELRASGQAVPELEVDLHSKIAFPVVSFVMGLVALPFAFRLGRRGALYGLGVAVVLGIVFLGVFAFFKTMGTAGALPPLVAVWSPSALFAMLSGYLFLGVRT